MRWLSARLIRSGRDRGATVVLIAILLPVVLLGIGAFVLDVGSWYVQKAQTQNGADAGAQAVALTCAKNASGCAASAATNYAPDNSTGTLDVSAKVTSGYPCGHDVNNILPSCPSPATDCPTTPPTGFTNYVNVHVDTDKVVQPLLGQIFGSKGGTVGTCAQAIWGNAAIGGDILALTIAECAWNTDTAGGTNYAPSPPAVPAAGFEKYLVIHNPDDANDPACTSGPNVGPLPGGFGWTTPNTTAPCQATFLSGGWYTSDPGQGTSTGSQCLDGGNNAGVIPCAQNPVATPTPYPPNRLNDCPTPPTPSPLIVPIYDNVCVQTGSSAVSQDEKQSVGVKNATSGTFKLTFVNGTSQTTAAIAYNANATAVQTALANLSNVGGTANVSVTGSGTTTSPFVVEFQGALGYTNYALMTADATNLRPNTGPTSSRAAVVVAAVQDGAFVQNACPSSFANGKYYHLATLAAFVVTGYHGSAFPHDKNSWLTNRNYCVNATGQDPPCLMGYFVKATINGGTIGGGPDTGVTVVKLNG